MIWEGVDLDEIEASLDALESETVGVEALSQRETEDTIALLSLEILQLTASLEAERQLRLSQSAGLRKAEALEGELHDLRRALTAAEARIQDAEARADAAEAEAASLRTELEDARAQAPAWVAIRDRHLADRERHAV